MKNNYCDKNNKLLEFLIEKLKEKSFDKSYLV